MYMGRLVERGATAAVLARPAHPYTAASWPPSRIPTSAEPAVAGLEGEVPSLRRPAGCEFHTRSRTRGALRRGGADAARGRPGRERALPLPAGMRASRIRTPPPPL